MRVGHCTIFLLAAMTFRLSAEPLKYLEMHKSAPVEINGLEFVAATQAQWICWTHGSANPIEMQLLITNRSGHSLLFRTCDTFGPILKDIDGRKLPAGGGRDGFIGTLPVLISAGDTYCLTRKADLMWKIPHVAAAYISDGKGNTIHEPDNSAKFRDEFGGYLEPDGKSSAFFYWDGTGSELFFRFSTSGTYHLLFSVSSSQEAAESEKRKVKGIPVWMGKADTGDVLFEIIEEKN
jgi:hypothetical protein